MRKEMILNYGWLFHKGDIKVETPRDKGPVYSQCKTERKLSGPASYLYNDRADAYFGERELNHTHWETVDLPHDYIVAQDLCRDENNALGYLHYDNAWYRKHFDLSNEDTEGKRITLRFDGIAGVSTVYLNGCLMYRNFSRYNSFEIDISDNVYRDRKNVIAVYVNTEEFEGWWYQGGGIYRDVYLTVTDPVAIDLWGVYAPYEKIGENEWRIDFETAVVNSSYEDVNVKLESSVLDKNGVCVGKAAGAGVAALREKTVVKYGAVVKDPLLWDCETPNLYRVKTVLKTDDGKIDENITRIGFRTVEISPEEGLRINGKKTFIKGVCGHQDFGLTGLAVPENVARYKVSLIKAMGANGYRTSHYQQTAAYMDAFDEMGFLVMDEARWFESTEESFKQIESLVKRDRNRPSVIFWSTGNEEPLHVSENGRRIHKAIAAFIKKLDHTRYITAAESNTPERSVIYDECDVVGINYNLEVYDTVHKMRPEKALFASECCATGTSRDWYLPTDTNGRIRDKDADSNSWFRSRESTWKFLTSRPFVIGCYQWISVDHRGEAAWPAISSKSGAIDMFLQKKGAFYQNKSHWTEEPMAHIASHWNFKGTEGQNKLITVYTNCDELDLLLNGRSQGRKKIEKYGHGEWNVPYAPGELVVKGYVNGKLAAEDKRVTTGKAVSLRLTPDCDFKNDGLDLALFTCECLDENGNVVPDASELVRFSVEAPARILGTGSDNCDHNNVANTERKMYMGKISIAVRPRKGQSAVVLTAFCDNCGTASVTVGAKEA